VDRPSVAPRAVADGRAVDDPEAVTRGVDPIDRLGGGEDAEVVEVAAVGLAVPRHEVDDRALVEAHRREGHLAPAPPLHPHARQAQLVQVPSERPLDVGAPQDQVIEALYLDIPHGDSLVYGSVVAVGVSSITCAEPADQTCWSRSTMRSAIRWMAAI